MSSSRTSIYVNGRDLADFGFVCTKVDGAWTPPARSDDRIVIPGRAGVLLTGAFQVEDPRILTVEGIVRQSTRTLLLTALDQINGLLANGLLRIRTIDTSAREILGRVAENPFTPTAPALWNPHGRIAFRVECPDPYWKNVEPDIIAFGATAVAMPIGTASTSPILRVDGPGTNIVITYRGADGIARATLTTTGVLAATDRLVAECSWQTMTVIASGVASSANSWPSLTSVFPELSPEDCDVENGVYGTLEASGLTGVGRCEAEYCGRWR